MTSPKIVDSPQRRELTLDNPERFILLQRPLFWSYIAASLLVGVGISAGVWAALARFDQTIAMTGNLELLGTGQDVKAPNNGVVQEIHVQEGEEVTSGETLATFKSTLSDAELEALQSEKAKLTQENQLYDKVLTGETPVLAEDAPSLAQQRVQLAQETQSYQALVAEDNIEAGAGSKLTANQQKLVAASSPESQSQVSAAQLQVQKWENQLKQTQEQLARAEKLLAMNQDFLDRLSQASQEVSVPRQQYQRQRQEVLASQTQVDRLQQERQQHSKELAGAKDALQNAIALAARDVLGKVTDNQKHLAQVDSQIEQAKQDNQNRIAEIDAQLNRAQQPQGEPLTAPIAGVVFDLQSSAPGYAAQAKQTLLTVMPDRNLVANVLLPNQHVASVKAGMEAVVRVPAFPQSGSIEGEVAWVGSEVIPPSPERPFPAVPARLQLDRLPLDANGKAVRLQDGMLVNCAIVLPQQQTVGNMLRERWGKAVQGIWTLGLRVRSTTHYQ